jgi:hypothetical protein
VWSVDCLVVAHPLAGGRFVRSRFEGLRFDENRCGFAGSPSRRWWVAGAGRDQVT